MMGQNWQNPYNQGFMPPYNGIFPGSQPGFFPGFQPPGYYPGQPQPVQIPKGRDVYHRQKNTPPQEEPEKKQPWYVTVGKETLKIGVIVGASVLGGVFFSVPGAIAAGAIASGAVSAVDQKVSKGKIDWGTVAIDTALGAIPGGAGSAVVKTGQRLLGREILKNSIKRGAVVGSVDGALMGYAGGMAHTAYDSYKKTGELNLNQANSAGLSSILPGAIGGAVAGGAFTAIGNKLSKKSTPQKTYTTQELADLPMDALKPPRRTWANRLIAKLTLDSEDRVLANMHTVDDTLLRGAMPESQAAFESLNARNVRTIIDLRGSKTTNPLYIEYERRMARQHGIKYVHIPMDSTGAPKPEELARLFRSVNQAKGQGQKVYIHCKHGIDRTGAMVAAYEVANKVAPKDAYRRMQQAGYNWYHEWSRPAQKQFVLSNDMPSLVQRVRDEALGYPSSSGFATAHPFSNPNPTPVNATVRDFSLSPTSPSSQGHQPHSLSDTGSVHTDSSNQHGSTSSSSEHPTVATSSSSPSTASVDSSPSLSSEQQRPVRVEDSGTLQRPDSSIHPSVIQPDPVPLFHGVDDLSALHFRQSDNLQDCFLLSAINAAQHHPNGKELLNRIKIAEKGHNYDVYFPSLAGEAVSVPKTRLPQNGVNIEKFPIPLLEQAYIQLMRQKVANNEINPLIGRDLMERLLNPQEAAALLRPYQVRDSQTLLRSVFSGPYYKQALQDIEGLKTESFDGRAVLTKQFGDSPEALKEYRDTLYGVIKNQPKGVQSTLETAFDAMKAEQQNADTWRITLPNGKQVDVSTDRLDPIELIEARSAQNLPERMKLLAITSQYQGQFMDGRYLRDFDLFSRQLKELSDIAHPYDTSIYPRASVFNLIKIENKPGGIEVTFPISQKKVLLEGLSIREGSPLTMEDRLYLVARAAEQAEKEIRLFSTVNYGTPDTALRHMFGPGLVEHAAPTTVDTLRPLLAADSRTLLTAVPKAHLADNVTIAPLNAPHQPIQPSKRHVYSVQPGRDEGSVIITDPRDTANGRYSMSIENFLQWFDVSGISF